MLSGLDLKYTIWIANDMNQALKCNLTAAFLKAHLKKNLLIKSLTSPTIHSSN